MAIKVSQHHQQTALEQQQQQAPQTLQMLASELKIYSDHYDECYSNQHQDNNSVSDEEDYEEINFESDNNNQNDYYDYNFNKFFTYDEQEEHEEDDDEGECREEFFLEEEEPCCYFGQQEQQEQSQPCYRYPPNRMMTTYRQYAIAQVCQNWQQMHLVQPENYHHVYGGDSYLQTIYEDIEFHQLQHNNESNADDDYEEEQFENEEDENDEEISGNCFHERHAFSDNMSSMDESSSNWGDDSFSESNYSLLMDENNNSVGNLLGGLYDSDDENEEEDDLFAFARRP